MENHLSKHTVSFGLSLALCSVLNAVLVIIKEKSPAVLAVMQKFPGHHWTAHVVIMVILFLFFGWLFAAVQKPSTPAGSLIKMVVAGVLAGCAIIIGFYLIAG